VSETSEGKPPSVLARVFDPELHGEGWDSLAVRVLRPLGKASRFCGEYGLYVFLVLSILACLGGLVWAIVSFATTPWYFIRPLIGVGVAIGTAGACGAAAIVWAILSLVFRLLLVLVVVPILDGVEKILAKQRPPGGN